MAPRMAIPREPPTCLMLFSTAEPTPALSMGTEPMAAAVVGVMASPMPAPPMRSGGKRSQKFEPASKRVSRSSESDTSAIPPVISQRDPIRSDSLPAIGASRTIRIVIGRKVAPAWVGE